MFSIFGDPGLKLYPAESTGFSLWLDMFYGQDMLSNLKKKLFYCASY